MKKRSKVTRQDGLCPGQDLNPVSLECESSAVPLLHPIRVLGLDIGHAHDFRSMSEAESCKVHREFGYAAFGRASSESAFLHFMVSVYVTESPIGGIGRTSALELVGGGCKARGAM
jgi:hypothetical protein